VGAQIILYMKILGSGIAFKICVSECSIRRLSPIRFDFSLMKAVSIEEMRKVQFRPEFFNVFNIQNYGLPRTTCGASSFGLVTCLASGATPGQIQFSPRLAF